MSTDPLTKGQKTRLSLIKAAQVLFAKKGYAETGVDEIVESINLTTGVFYSNFKSKEDLLKTVLKTQIDFSKRILLTRAPNESDQQWLQRALSTYLSSQHRDSIESSCPLTTMSQELIKLGLDKKTGLSAYLADFESSLSECLDSISSGKGSLAPALISMCVGAIQTSRMQKNQELSDLYLLNTKKAALGLIFGSSSLKGTS